MGAAFYSAAPTLCRAVLLINELHHQTGPSAMRGLPPHGTAGPDVPEAHGLSGLEDCLRSKDIVM